MIKEGAEKLIAKASASLEKPKADESTEMPVGSTREDEVPAKSPENMRDSEEKVVAVTPIVKEEIEPLEQSGPLEVEKRGADAGSLMEVEVEVAEKGSLAEGQGNEATKPQPSFEDVSKAAYLNFRGRCEQNLPGDEQSDWYEAVRSL